VIWMLLLGAVGLTVVLVRASIAEPLRNALPPPIGLRGLSALEREKAKVLLCCSLCTGTWVGWALGLYAWWLGLFAVEGLLAIPAVGAFGFAAAICSYVVETWLRRGDPPKPH